MCICQAVMAEGNYFRSAGKCLIVEVSIWCGPVKVLAGQHISPELAMISHPSHSLKIVGCPQDCGLVSPELRPFFGEACHKEGCHACIALQPQLNVCNWWLGGSSSGCLMSSATGGSSTHMSARSSAISTNSKLRIFLTTFGKDTAVLYGPGDFRSMPRVGTATAGPAGPGWREVAAAARSNPKVQQECWHWRQTGVLWHFPQLGGICPCTG